MKYVGFERGLLGGTLFYDDFGDEYFRPDHNVKIPTEQA